MADEIVTSEPGKESQLRELWKKEDYWAIWLGVLIVVVGLMLFVSQPPEGMHETMEASNATMVEQAAAAPFRTVAWFKAGDAKAKVRGTNLDFAKKIKSFTSKPHGWKTNPVEALYLSDSAAGARRATADTKYQAVKEEAAAALALALAAEERARAAGFADDALNEDAKSSIAVWRDAKYSEGKARKKTTAKAYHQWISLIGLAVVLAVFFGVPMHFMGGSTRKFIIGFFFVFAIAVLAYMMSTQSTMKEYGIGYAAWAIFFGMLISNTVGTPKWVMPAVQTEYFIKTGLVILGAEILFGKILTIGIPGIFVAWIVTPIVLVTTYIFGQKVIKIPSKTLNITISADMSVCGVSAAIATAAACRAKKEELTLAVGLSLVFTSIMMILMPLAINKLGIPHVLGGAWMGGTIDATGAVAAAGAFLSDQALHVAATIKMIQNVLIGATAFFVALYWVTRVERQQGQRVGLMEIWYRFPKFVLGFIAISIIFSIIYSSLGPDAGYTLIDQGVIKGFSKTFRGWFFCLAFVSIGLATNFRELATYFKGGKPLILYVCGQSFNLCLTFIMAYIMFYVVFPEITARI